MDNGNSQSSERVDDDLDADVRDNQATADDVAAGARDRAAEDRDARAEARDYGAGVGADNPSVAPMRERAANDRAAAAGDRDKSGDNRARAREDRTRSADDRRDATATVATLKQLLDEAEDNAEHMIQIGQAQGKLMDSLGLSSTDALLQLASRAAAAETGLHDAARMIIADATTTAAST